MSDLPIFVDIDGTLTDSPQKGGKPLLRRIDAVRLMIRSNKQVVVWSANGTEYAREFCRRHSLTPLAVIGKPNYCIDDNPQIRPKGVLSRPPEILDS